MTKPDQKKEWERLFNGLAEYVSETDAEELLEDAKQDDPDLDARLENLDFLLQRTLLLARKTKLQDARESYIKALDSIKAAAKTLPIKIAEKRDLLLRIFDLNPTLGNQLLTVHHRHFEELTDDDIDTLLQQLEALGVLADPHQKNSTSE